MVLKVETRCLTLSWLYYMPENVLGRHCGHTNGQVIPLHGTDHLEGKSDNKMSDGSPFLHGDGCSHEGTNTENCRCFIGLRGYGKALPKSYLN